MMDLPIASRLVWTGSFLLARVAHVAVVLLHRSEPDALVGAGGQERDAMSFILAEPGVLETREVNLAMPGVPAPADAVTTAARNRCAPPAPPKVARRVIANLKPPGGTWLEEVHEGGAARPLSRSAGAMSLQTAGHFGNAGVGAGLIFLTSGCAGDPNCTNNFVANLDWNATTDGDNVGDLLQVGALGLVGQIFELE